MSGWRVNLAGAFVASFVFLLLALVDHIFAGSLAPGARTLSVLGAASLGAVLLLPVFFLLASIFARSFDKPWSSRIEVFLCVTLWSESLWSFAVYLNHPRLPLATSQLYWYAYGLAPALLLGVLAARSKLSQDPTPLRRALLRASLVALALWGLWWNPHFRQYPSQIAASCALGVFAMLLSRPLAHRTNIAISSGVSLLLLAGFGLFYVGGSAMHRDQAARGGRLTRLLLRLSTPLLRPFGQDLKSLAEATPAAQPTPQATHQLSIALKDSKPSNVLIMTVDALRADFGGLKQNDTLEALRRESVSFGKVRTTAANTTESMASIFLGRHHFAGVKGPSLPGIFRRAGFFTINIQPDTFLKRREHSWVESDFDHFVGSMKYEYPFAPNSDQMTDAMLTALDKAGEKPFFAWMHYNDPHHPYDAEGDSDKERYQNEVNSTLKQIGRLLDGMKQRGLLDKTMVILTADHGEEFKEHDGTTHSLTLYDEVLRTPLLIRAPGGVVRGSYDENTSILGLAPALLDWFQLKGEEGFAPDKRDLFAGSSTPLFAFRVLTKDLTFGDAAVIVGDYKLIYNFEVEAVQLYDLSKDPSETTNIADDAPEKTRLLASILFAEIERILTR